MKYLVLVSVFSAVSAFACYYGDGGPIQWECVSHGNEIAYSATDRAFEYAAKAAVEACEAAGNEDCTYPTFLTCKALPLEQSPKITVAE